MKTEVYNPSQLEVELASAIKDLHGEIEKKLSYNKIIKIENNIHEDNPLLKIDLQDKDGDLHKVVIKIIQKADL